MTIAQDAGRPEVSDEEVEAALNAYDVERCRLNVLWHGGKCEPMSDAAKANVAAMMSAALEAAAKVRASRPSPEGDAASEVAETALATARNAALEEAQNALREILKWSEAYPTSAFPEPDAIYLRKSQEVLSAYGMSLDCLSAHAMRHVVEEVAKIAREALADAPVKQGGAS